MSWVTAQWVWTAGIFAALGVAVGFAFRESLGRHAPWVFAFLMVACTFLMPIRDQVRFGQVDILLVALCLADCVARRPWWPRGFLIGLATAVKLTPGVFLIYLLVTRQWRTLFMASLVTALLTLLPFAVIPQDAVDFWFGALLDSERLGANAATTNQSMRGMLIRLYLPDLLTTAIWLAVVAAVGWYGFRGARDAYRRGDTLTAVALVGLMAVLLSPVAWIHHLAWVVVVLGGRSWATDATRCGCGWPPGCGCTTWCRFPGGAWRSRRRRSRWSARCSARSCRTASAWARSSSSGCWRTGCRGDVPRSPECPT
ncbi:glycosyltransferase family 87 protein [Nonomuraea ferruginea]